MTAVSAAGERRTIGPSLEQRGGAAPEGGQLPCEVKRQRREHALMAAHELDLAAAEAALEVVDVLRRRAQLTVARTGGEAAEIVLRAGAIARALHGLEVQEVALGQLGIVEAGG